MKSILALFCLLPIIINGQEGPDPSSFFPSSIGNVWEYSTQWGIKKNEIIHDSLDQRGNKYLFYHFFYHPDYKIDTKNNVYLVHASIDTILYHYYKLDADLGETWKVRTDPPGTLARVDEIYTDYLWGEERYVKKIGFYRPPYPFEDTTVTEDAEYERYVLLVSGIGEYYEFNYESGPERILLGCTIDGVTYGMVDVEEPPEIPSEFTLYQNYPNPFNPNTTVKFKLPASGNVKLTIFSVLGEKIADVMNSYLTEGTHQVNIDFSKYQVGSGVYIYLVNYNNQRTFKKMIYLK